MSVATTPSDLVDRLERDGLAGLTAFVGRQRWFAAKARAIERVRVEDWAALDAGTPLVLLLIRVDGERYYMPVAVAREAAGGDEAIARAGSLAIVDAHGTPALGRQLLAAIAEGRELFGHAGRFVCRPLSPWKGPTADQLPTLAARVLSGEQSNTSIALGSDLILKSFRRPRPGVNPEVEISRFLTERTRFRHSPALIGWVDYTDDVGDTAAVAVVQQLVTNTGDGWRHVLRGLARALDSLASARTEPSSRIAVDDVLVAELRELGRVTGSLHAALAVDAAEPAFAPEPVTADDTRRWASAIADAVRRLGSDARAGRAGVEVVRALEALTISADVPARIADGLHRLVAAGAHKIRCHGDYHLGQVLRSGDTFAVIDFEGEPARSLAERRSKQSPLRDVAGMLRSFDYAAHSALRERPSDERAPASRWLDGWEQRARDAFLDGYEAAVSASPVRLAPPSRAELVRACVPFEIDKACYELAYELNNRPDWVAIPLAGLARLLA